MLRIFCLSFLLIVTVNCANILGIFPTPSISHQVVFHALIKELAKRGHQLTILTPDLIKVDNQNVTQVDLHDSYEVMRRKFNFVDFKDKKSTEHDLLVLFYDLMLDFFDLQLSHPEVKKLMNYENNKKFDLVILEHLNYLPFLAFAEIYDCPVIGITSLEAMFVVHKFFGNEHNPAIHSEFFFAYEHGKLSFIERLKSLVYYLRVKFITEPKHMTILNNVVKKHFPNITKSVESMKERIQLLITNTNPAMGFIRPLLPNTIQLGFMHIEPPKSLPAGELKTFLDNSKNGVIYMSLGSNVQSKDLSPEILQTFLKVFGSLSFDVLWKFEADNLPDKPSNVMISKWLPQSDLLAHPKIKLFITQGGQQSMEEAIDRTIPMIDIPFLADQDSNAKRLVERGVGYHLELHSLTEPKLLKAINEMLKPKYKENIKKLRELVYDQPITSRERAVWWTEFVIRHKGAKHLEYPGRSVPFYQKYWLDFIGIALICVVVFAKLLKALILNFISTEKSEQKNKKA
jgi:glucuronosyltransferase